jgi:hypothetical protein
VARQTKTFEAIPTDDSTAQDPNNVLPLMKFIADCKATVHLGSFVKYTCYAATKKKWQNDYEKRITLYE